MIGIFHYLLISIGINLLMFIPAFIFKTDKLTDISYALTFIALAAIALIFGNLTTPTLLLTIMVVAWGLRLGIFLFARINKMKRDRRFDGMRESFPKFLQFWVLQGLSVWLIMIPSLLFIGKANASVCWLGLLVWLVGISIETISDLQKNRFKDDPKNKGKFINIGLWKYSRHPNYFGEIFCWVGIYLFVFRDLALAEKLFALISPLYITILLVFVTGLPPLEKYADEKWGKTKAYIEYKRKTSILVPWFTKR